MKISGYKIIFKALGCIIILFTRIPKICLKILVFSWLFLSFNILKENLANLPDCSGILGFIVIYSINNYWFKETPIPHFFPRSIIDNEMFPLFGYYYFFFCNFYQYYRLRLFQNLTLNLAETISWIKAYWVFRSGFE